MTQETLREAVARIIAAELGDDFDAAFVDKAAWINARGQSGGRFRDVNEPFQSDYLHAADAAIATMFERLRTPSEGLIEAGKAIGRYEGHHVYCRHIEDDTVPCVCGYLAAHERVRNALAKLEASK